MYIVSGTGSEHAAEEKYCLLHLLVIFGGLSGAT